jgi:hypothetical protein
MTTIEDKIKKFENLVIDAIDVREKALHPDNPLFELPISVQDEEMTLKEQNLLKCILVQYRVIFGAEE